MPKTAEAVQVEAVEVARIAAPEKAPKLANGPVDSSAEGRLRALITAKLEAAGRSIRWAEKQMNIAHGTLAHILAGRSAMKLEHLELFARLFNTSPAALLAEATGQSALIVQVKVREKLVPALKSLLAHAVELRSEVPVSPREDAIYENGEDDDLETALRSILECLINQHLPEAIQAAEEIAAFRVKGRR